MSPKIKFILILSAAVIFSTLILLQGSKIDNALHIQPSVKINDIAIEVDIADNKQERSQGLSGRDSLAENEGMLFVFERHTTPTFWMKDMNFPIDIIWISDERIVQIDESVPNPEPGTSLSKLPLYAPSQPVNYVLEVNAGFSEDNGIGVGDLVDLSGAINR